MSATREGGLKARDTNKAKYGEDYYKVIGAIGGKLGKGHAFAHGRVDPSKAGAIGGRISKRGPARDYK